MPPIRDPFPARHNFGGLSSPHTSSEAAELPSSDATLVDANRKSRSTRLTNSGIVEKLHYSRFNYRSRD